MSEKEEVQPLSPTVKRHITNLQNPNPRQRSHAAAELGKLQTIEAVPALIKALREDVNTYVRSAAAESLGHLGDPRAIFPLMDALRDSSSFVRRAAAIALGQLEAKEAQVALLNALEDSNYYVRRAAINAIGKLGILDLARVLIPLLDTDDPRIRRTTITALRRLHARQAIPKMIEMLESYMEAPSSRDLSVVKTLVIALGDLEACKSVDILIRVLRGYVGARSLAAKALGQIGERRAGSALTEALECQSTSLRLAALRSLADLEYEQALPVVRSLLSDPDPRIRRDAALTLGRLGDREAIPHLLSLVREDPSPLVRPAAVEALAMVGDGLVLEELLPLVEDPNAYLRAALAKALCSLGSVSPKAREALRRLARDQVQHVATAAERSLQQLEKAKTKGEPQSCTDSDFEEQERSWLRWLLDRI